MNEKLRLGLFGVGLDTYWAQFYGLKERLISYQSFISTKLINMGIEVYDAGLLDSPISCNDCVDYFRSNKIDALVLYISTYSLSHTVLPILQKLGVPLLILNLQPEAAIDYDKFNGLQNREEKTGEWLAYCQACSLPEIACVCNQSNIKYSIVTGFLTNEKSWEKIKKWIEAVSVKVKLSKSRFGILGHYYCGMLDVYTDVTKLASVFGCHFEILEMEHLADYRKNINKVDLNNKINELEEIFDISSECPMTEIERVALTSIALERLVENMSLNGIAYYYEGSSGGEMENIVTSLIVSNTLLTYKHIPTAGECEVKNVVAMKIMDLFGAGGSFSEIYACDFNDDVVLWGHDGPAHPDMSDGRVSVVPLSVYHGKPGDGLSIQMSVKNGPVTFLSVVQRRDGQILLLTAEGEAVEGPTLMIGNTNSRYKFSIGAEEFVNRWSEAGPSHHCAIGIGHISDKIELLSKLIGADFLRVC